MVDTDLLVIGGGMAGLTAAARAAKDGLRVVVVEIGDDVGGSARFAGYAWTAPSHEVMDAVNPRGDRALRHALVDRFADGIEWIRSLGVEAKDPVPLLGFGRGHQFDTNQYVDLCRQLVVRSGGEVRLRTQTSRLLTQDGRVVGAELTGPDGPAEVRATWTLLATGGLQGDPEMLREKVHPRAGDLQLRANPHSSGAGYRLATAVGAATGPEDAGFYGHLVPSGVPFADPSDFVDLSLYYSEHALLLNVEGRRFTDETLGDHLTTMALLEQPEARGLLVCDARVHRDWIVASYVEGAVAVDKFAIASRRGGRVGLAETLDELEYLPEEWGYDGAAIAKAIEEFNRAAAAGEPLEPARRNDAAPIDEGPWYVIECEPAVTFTFHGIRTDDRARVLGTDGLPLLGLLCAGSDSGGLYHRAYAGGLAPALVFGLAAAATAAARVTA
ncbi:succinate dehydrogenase/fumarate reductase flavoprotein subunit [Nocardioides aromaticivorans]|uniref:Succinate dehydrogenase/fumarate reductase flavoprotein subunit n=1 Tax=Nocardioides aromaticivorans TaxID=200618 RepID=A0A7Y9ZJ48_9ACTN|nr:FAD-dependent oxidoreductase [Nocardioides aromaticivorans]NYI45293.1 succinate dehydrogenase/fumarate reductase flavoprotein subunit [Nocardioides aromaticivorans]